MEAPNNPNSIYGNTPPGMPGGQGAQNQNVASYSASAGGGGWGSFEKWLGKAGYKTFQTNLCNQINQQIQKDKETTQKAADKLKASYEGKDPNDDS